MALSLSALHVGIIPFDTAVSVVIGSELGTSIKIILGALDGIVDKKRLAYGNVIFNIVITFFSFVFMYPLIGLIKTVFQIKEPLIGLVLFQTIINLFGILLFIPFLDSFEKFLQKIVQQKNGSTTYFIQNTNPLVATLALEVIEKETLLFIHRIINLNLEAFNINDVEIKKADFLNGIREKNKNITYSEKYDKIKHAEGEILSVFTKISEDKIEKDDFIRLNQLISSIRNAMYSAKGIKNIEHDRKELSDSIIEIKYEQYKFIQTQLREFYKNLNQLLNSNDQLFCSKELIRLMNQIQNEYEIRLNNIYKHSEKNTLEETEISTLLNVSREVYSSCKAIIFSLKDYLLTPQKAEEFDNAPLVIIN
jgi:phosphate:Na+ symporter